MNASTYAGAWAPALESARATLEIVRDRTLADHDDPTPTGAALREAAWLWAWHAAGEAARAVALAERLDDQSA